MSKEREEKRQEMPIDEEAPFPKGEKGWSEPGEGRGEEPSPRRSAPNEKSKTGA